MYISALERKFSVSKRIPHRSRAMAMNYIALSISLRSTFNVVYIVLSSFSRVLHIILLNT